MTSSKQTLLKTARLLLTLLLLPTGAVAAACLLLIDCIEDKLT